MDTSETYIKMCKKAEELQANSPVKIWLAFVMKERFGKVWSGIEWVRR